MKKELIDFINENFNNWTYDVKDIAEKFDISVPTVYRYLSLYNVKKKKEEDSRLEEITKMRNEGKTYEEIGARFNVSRQRIEQLIHGYN